MLKKLAPYTRGYRWYILLGVLCSVGEAVLELELPQAMSAIVDVGIANGDRSYILLTGLKMLLMAMAALACGVGAAVMAAKAAMGFGANIRQAEYEQVQRFSFANIEHFSTASLITRLTNDVASVQMTLFMGMRICVRAPVMLVTALIKTMEISLSLSQVFLVAVPLLAVADVNASRFLIVKHALKEFFSRTIVKVLVVVLVILVVLVLLFGKTVMRRRRYGSGRGRRRRHRSYRGRRF